ncbi:MAG: guanylyltransferase, partial [Methanobacterium sp.]|nr:guanylyltransferase [Methanobacterium sp.]
MDKNQAMNQLKGLKSSQIHDLLFERGINISEVPAWQRRGVGIYKGEIEIKGYNPLHKKDVLTTRKKIITDWDLPIFNQDFFQEMEL